MYKAYIKEARKQPDYLKYLGADRVYTKPLPEYPELEGSESVGNVRIRVPGGDGATYALVQENVKKRGDNIDVWFNSPGKKLIQDPNTGIIHGVMIEVDGVPKYVRAKNGVVLATGGFENNPEMFRNFVGVQDAYAKGAHFNTGDGINMSMDVGANMINMAGVAGPDPNVINPATGNSFGYVVAGDKNMEKVMTWNGPIFTYRDVIMVGPDGKRFWNETANTRHGRINVHGDYLPLRMPSKSYMIFDEDARKASKVYGSWSEGAVKEIESGLVKKADTIADLANIIGVDVQGLIDEVARYNQFTQNGKDEDFGRAAEYLVPLDNGPFYAVEVVPTYTNTQGGPERDANAEILDRNGNPIPHLYGAGELGSIWTHYYNGGGNIGESLVFGRIAGANASTPKTDVTQESVLAGKPSFRPASTQGGYVLEEGEKVGVGHGIGGEIVIAIKTDGDQITSVRILSHGETEGIGAKALEVLPGQAVANNGKVDNYSGASVSSAGFNEALADALSK